tara:strand:- start:108 stop:500 length:393 start_codon:yes stop_codon:yes gene_type:complete
MAVMPKPKPDQVIRHEIVLSRPLQETIDGLVGSAQFRNIATPTVDLMKDVSGMAVFLSLVAALGLTGIGFNLILSGQEETAEEVIQLFLNQSKVARAGRGAEALGSAAGSLASGIDSGISDFLDSILSRK